MSDAFITVEHLAKSYLVGHRFGGLRPGDTFRDVIMHEAGDFSRRAFDMVRGRQVVQGDEIEEFWALKDVSFEAKNEPALAGGGRGTVGAFWAE